MVLKLSEDLVATIEYKQRIGADLEFVKGTFFISLENEPFTCLREKGRDWIQVQVIFGTLKQIQQQKCWSKMIHRMFKKIAKIIPTQKNKNNF